MERLKSLQDKSLKEIITKSSGYFVLRILGLIFSYIFAYITTNYFGKNIYGFVTLGFSFLMILSVVSRFGLDINLMRIVSQSGLNRNKKLYFKSVALSSTISISLALIIYFSSDFIAVNIFAKPDFKPYLEWVAFTIPMWSLILINSNTFRGLKLNFHYAFFNSFGRFFLSLLVLCVFVFLIESPNSHSAIISHSLGLFLLLFGSFLYLLKLLLKDKYHQENNVSFKSFLGISAPMFLSTSIIILLAWLDKIFLGYFTNEGDIAIYDISIRIAALIGFTLEALNSILTPKISKAFSQKDFKKMQKEITFSAKLNFYISTALFIVIIIFSNQILSIFSKEFVAGQTVLIICCFGQLVNSFSGPVGNILQMTGFHKLFTKIMFLALVINIVLNLLLIHLYSMNGAAIAFCISIIFWNFISSYFIYKKLGVKSFYLPFIS